MKKKKILILIILLLSYTNVYAITSNEVIYNDDTVTNALDELLNVCRNAGNAPSDKIAPNYTAYVQGKIVTGNMPSISATTYTPGTSDKIIKSGAYTTGIYISGVQTIKGDSNLVGSNIATNKTIFGVTGTYDSDATAGEYQILNNYTAYKNGSKVTGRIPLLPSGTYNPAAYDQIIYAGYYLNGNQTIKGDSNLVESNIACGITIFGVKGTKGCKCKRASTLHSDGTHTYGQIGTSGTLKSGDAFDCDVNGDGTFDATTERFYYVSDYYDGSTDTFDSNYATLIYYNNVYYGAPNNTVTYAYDSENTNYNGPRMVIAHIPAHGYWKNVQLTNIKRTIKNQAGGLRTNSSNLIANPYSYMSKSARLLTYQELKSGCTNVSTISGSLDSCSYLMENTRYQNSSYSVGYWLETPYYSSSTYAWYVNGSTRSIAYGNCSASDFFGVRPAIDVLKSDILY